MHNPVREGILRPVPEEPWWWPLGPAGILVAMFAGVTWFSSTWPLASEVLVRLRGSMFEVLGLLFIAWVLLAVWLRQRRSRWMNQPVWIVIDAAGLTLDEEQLAWENLTHCEWSPFGLLYHLDGRRQHFAARVTDAQVARLNAALQAFQTA